MTYASLALVFLAVAVLFAAVSARAVRLSRRWWLCSLIVAAVLLVLTAAFDSVMIAIDLFRYDTDALTGLRVLLVPIEDFAWPLVAVLVLPTLWEVLGRRGDERDGGRNRAQVGELSVGGPAGGPESGTAPTPAPAPTEAGRHD